jgi:hypothetical protein
MPQLAVQFDIQLDIQLDIELSGYATIEVASIEVVE